MLTRAPTGGKIPWPARKGAGVSKVILCIVLILAIIYLVPFVVYGIGSVLFGLKPPEGASPLQFLLSVFVSKIGTAIAFVLIFYLARNSLGEKWLLYAFAWWLMFVIGEVGQVIAPNYSWKEAVAGIISETIYFPLSGLVVTWQLGVK
jgi:hypothetical protein